MLTKNIPREKTKRKKQKKLRRHRGVKPREKEEQLSPERKKIIRQVYTAGVGRSLSTPKEQFEMVTSLNQQELKEALLFSLTTKRFGQNEKYDIEAYEKEWGDYAPQTYDTAFPYAPHIASRLEEKSALETIDELAELYKKEKGWGPDEDWHNDIPALDSLVQFGSTQKVREKAFDVRYGKDKVSIDTRGYPMWKLTSENPEAKKVLIDNWLRMGGGANNIWFSSAVSAVFNGKESTEVYWNGESIAARGGLNGVLVKDIPKGLLEVVTSIYNDTQEYYKNNPKKIPKELHRGVSAAVTTSSPLESWTAEKSTAKKFDGHAILNSVAIDPKTIFMSYEATAGWAKEETLKGKKEYTLIGGK